MEPHEFEGRMYMSVIRFGDVQVADVVRVDTPEVKYRLLGMLRFEVELGHYLLIDHVIHQQLLLYSVFLYFADNFGQRDVGLEGGVEVFDEELLSEFYAGEV